MCGILGAVTKSGHFVQKENLLKGLEKLFRRGPDAHNIFIHGQVGLAHARLSIIDTSEAANQPFTDATGRYVIIFNGEIFNYRQLRKQYLKDVKFNTSSDTEVLLNLYILKGKECLNLLNGFFAFAIYDKFSGEVFIARDRYGIKPLVYYENQDIFLFGSELKALIAFGIHKEIDFSALHFYFQLNYFPLETCVLKDCKKLKPGSYLILKNGKVYYTSQIERNSGPSASRQ
ncbi:MAG: hypothetical protein RMJ53_04330 [Chitinophagales bacterium]|nr:hypothetical protein [Chitinophagales bacterium]